MHFAIPQNAVLSAANPLLDIYIQKPVTAADGTTTWLLGAPDSLEFQIFNLADPDAPTQVFPASAGTKQTVNLTTDKVSTGRYAAAGWTVASNEPKVRHEIRWFYRLTAGGPLVEVRRDFDVVGNVFFHGSREPRGYCLVADLREEGLPSTDATDYRVQRLIVEASAFVERATGRVFAPVYGTRRLDGGSGRVLLLDEPLIALEAVTIGDPAGAALTPGTFRIYNRHITHGLAVPDDRADPKLEFLEVDERSRDQWGIGASVVWDINRWPKGTQNVNVAGLWGYTDNDGSAVGVTPALIRRVTKLLVLREAFQMTSDDREDRQNRHRLTSERVRDQSYTLSAQPQGAFTGDRAIDDILWAFRRPLRLGSA